MDDFFQHELRMIGEDEHGRFIWKQQLQAGSSISNLMHLENFYHDHAVLESDEESDRSIGVESKLRDTFKKITECSVNRFSNARSNLKVASSIRENTEICLL